MRGTSDLQDLWKQKERNKAIEKERESKLLFDGDCFIKNLFSAENRDLIFKG